MYHALLTNRYLTSRVIPLIAVAAVALCVALVIIVVSVMTGFLNKVRSAGRTLMGDVVVSFPIAGIPYYDRLIDRIEAIPGAAAATPVVDGWGLLRMPYPDGGSKEVETVQFWGIDETFSEVTGYADTIHWRELADWQRDALLVSLAERHALDLLAASLAEPWSAWADALEPVQRRALRDAWPASLADLADPGLDRAARRARLETLTRARWRTALERIDPLVDSIRAPLLDSLGAEQLKLLDLALEDGAAGLRAWLTAADVRALLEDLPPDERAALRARDPRLADQEALAAEALRLAHGPDGRDGIALGIHVSKANERRSDGTYDVLRGGYWWMPRFDVLLTTIPSRGGSFDEPETHQFKVVNEFISGVYLIDSTRVMIPLAIAQEMLQLDAAQRLGADGETIVGEDPARATMILVRARAGTTSLELRDLVREAYDRFAADVRGDPTALVLPPEQGFGLSIITWEEQQASFIGPVEKERELMRTLFSLIYLVCAGLVLAIFWAIVYEKTRDIGILRSLGASRLGISWIFLRYGLVVGVLGAIAGLGLATLVVRNINAIHEALGDPPAWLGWLVGALAVLSIVVTVVRALSGRLLPLVLGSLVSIVLLALATGILALRHLSAQGRGFVMWDPAVYYFAEIPNEVDMTTACITMAGAVVFSLIGAFIPAAKAADTDPVRALRYE